jgi:hypothetical protein
MKERVWKNARTEINLCALGCDQYAEKSKAPDSL